MAIPINNNEPITLTAGDTLTFQRSLSNYPASEGWQLVYEIAGNGSTVEFKSSANGNTHLVNVTAVETSGWGYGSYMLIGFAVKASTSERKQIYANNLAILQNAVVAASVDVRTHAQKMLDLIEAVQLGKAGHDILESDVDQTRIKRLSPKELRDEYNYWKQIRNNEIKIANSLAGRSNGRNRLTVFSDPNGATLGQFGVLPPIFPFGNINGQ